GETSQNRTTNTRNTENTGNGGESSKYSENVFPGNIRFIGPLTEGDYHLIFGEGIGPKKKGVRGGHNKESFYKALEASGCCIDDLLIGSAIEHPFVKGIYSQHYRVPAYDGKGNFIGYKDIPDPKTYFDPEMISNEQMIQWAKEAMTNGTINGRYINGEASNGLKFQGSIQENGQLRYYPYFEE
ncbi:MAG: EndoU domain-containing protein, partial [Clostridia bacterium]|nr:EndoU domain-containing protein [Clostridia bacterium]